MDLLSRIRDKKARIGIIGLGYVGLPLAIEFVKAGFSVKGFDIDAKKIKALNSGKSYIRHIPIREIRGIRKNGNFNATDDFSLLREIDCIIICVPTPLNRYREPDLSFVLQTVEAVARILRKGQLIVLESTTYPGTTDGDMRKILESTGMKAGRDFFLAYSPERDRKSVV